MNNSVCLFCLRAPVCALTWLGVLKHRREAAPHKAGPLRLYALDLRQRRSDDGLDGLQGRRHGQGHRVVCRSERSFPKHARNQKEHCGKDGHASCRGDKETLFSVSLKKL